MKSLITLSMLLALAACSNDKTKKGPQSLFPDKNTNSQTTEPSTGNTTTNNNGNGNTDQAQNDGAKAYTGKNLELDFKSAQRLGKIKLYEQDAERFFNVLEIQAEAVVGVDGQEELTKTAENIQCSKSTCLMTIDFKNGSVNDTDKVGEASRKDLVRIGRYSGENLTISRSILGIGNRAQVILTGKDAETLFGVIEATPEEIKSRRRSTLIRKEGEAISCTSQKIEEQQEFKCTILLKASKGRVINLK